MRASSLSRCQCVGCSSVRALLVPAPASRPSTLVEHDTVNRSRGYDRDGPDCGDGGEPDSLPLPEYPKVLDVGCAGGMLAGELPPSVYYLGIDASESAIEAAQSLWGGDDIQFRARDIREFEPAGNWDAIVFSEVLSYLAERDAIAEVRRYAKALSPEGVVAISMMNDGKSRAIWRALRQEFRWIDGILWQQKEPWPSYRISVSASAQATSSGCSDYGAEGRRIRRLANWEQSGRRPRRGFLPFADLAAPPTFEPPREGGEGGRASKTISRASRGYLRTRTSRGCGRGGYARPSQSSSRRPARRSHGSNRNW